MDKEWKSKWQYRKDKMPKRRTKKAKASQRVRNRAIRALNR